jgi:hypothetical protein
MRSQLAIWIGEFGEYAYVIIFAYAKTTRTDLYPFTLLYYFIHTIRCL